WPSTRLGPFPSTWQRRTNLWRERTNLRTGSERLKGVCGGPTDAQVIAGCRDGHQRLNVQETLVMKTYGNIILMTAICIVIFWVFMALRPADAARIRCGSSWEICAQRGKGPGLSHPIIRDNIRRGLDRPEQRQQPR